MNTQLTASICPECFLEIPAILEARGDGSLWMQKTCPVHGPFEALCQPDVEFERHAISLHGSAWVNPPVCLVEVTHRCNNRCPNCYHGEDRGMPEPTAEEILARATGTDAAIICLIGGEPTLRADLPDIVSSIGAMNRIVTMYTNGIRLAEPGLAANLAAAGMVGVGFSLHHPDYSSPSVFQKKLAALEILPKSGLILDHLSFSLEAEDQIPGILDLMERYAGLPQGFRIRSAYRAEGPRWFVADLYRLVRQEAERRGAELDFIPGCQNTRYQVGFTYRGLRLWLMSWPGVADIDFSHARGAPEASFTGGLVQHFCRAVVTQEGLRRGWFAGRRLQ